MRYQRIILLAFIGLALVASSGCYVRIVGPPLFIPVPVPIGGWGYHHDDYGSHHYH
jgi:hypothetical protein